MQKNEKNSQKIIFGGNSSKAKSRRSTVPAIVLLVVFGVAVFVIAVARQGEGGWIAKIPGLASGTCPNKETAEVYARAAEAIHSGDYEMQKAIASEIEKSSGFEKDPSCLYVVTSTYIAEKDRENASKYMEKLKAAYDEGRGYARELAQIAIAPDELQKAVDSLSSEIDFGIEVPNE